MQSREQTEQEDDRGIEPYDIEGWRWFLAEGRHVTPDMYIPGYGREVYKLVEKAGYTLNMEATHYVTMMVSDGEYDFLPRTHTRDREKFNEAMSERIGAEKFYDEGKYWTLRPEREVEE